MAHAAPRRRAFCVHLLTASGAVFAMLALLAASAGQWGVMFLWLVVAFAVDGVDGPLARRYDTPSNAPSVDGSTLDLIVDYLTYVFIPAYALFWSGLLPDLASWSVMVAITLGSALYFAGTGMKTNDKSFRGFPGCWNMVVLVIFAVRPEPAVTMLVVAVLTAAMFLPLRFVHPVRTRRWRALTLPVALLWTALAAWAAWLNFETGAALRGALAAASLYLVGVGVAQQMTAGGDARPSPAE